MTRGVPNKAVIYTRYASIQQSQTENGPVECCRKFANDQNMKVVKVFDDKGFSGNDLDRPGLQAMLAFLSNEEPDQYAVIVQDRNRLASNLVDYIKLRSSINNVGGVIKSPSFNVTNTADSLLHDNFMAAREFFISEEAAGNNG